MATKTKEDKLLEEYHHAANAYLRSMRCSGKNGEVQKQEVERITKSFERRGLKIRYGRWTIKENKLLHANFAEFVKANKELIGNPVDLIITSEDATRKHEARALKKELGFLLCLSKGLFRDRYAITAHYKWVLDPLAVCNGQKYSVEDLHLLKSLVDKHGKDWRLISKEMGRSAVSVQSCHRNFFLHEGYLRQPPTKKQQRKLCREMLKHFPNKDLTCEYVKHIPWNRIANKIGYMHGKYLCTYWELKVKYIDEEGKLRLRDPPKKLPPKLIRKFIRHATKQQPTHKDALDWAFYYKMFAGHVPGVTYLKALIPNMLRRYKIDDNELGLPEAMKRLNSYIKRAKKLGFQSIWEEIKASSVKTIRWQQYHWVLSPELAHYAQEMPTMYWGYGEDHSEIKQEPIEMDEVW